MEKMDKIMNDLYKNEIAADIEPSIQELSDVIDELKEKVLPESDVAELEYDVEPEDYEEDDCEEDDDCCCNGTRFCCIITIPRQLDVDRRDASAVVSFDRKCINISEPESIYDTVDGCPVHLLKFRITGCLTVHASLPVTSQFNLDSAHVCCSDCICIDDCVICCKEEIDKNDLRFEVKRIRARRLRVRGGACGHSLYKVRGKIAVSLDNCF